MLMPDPLEFAYDVFISYSHRERDWVRGELLPRLERAGLRAFVDFRDFRPGAPSLTEMERGVATCRKTLLVLTPDYIQSGWCEIESVMSQTRDPANRALRLIPILKAGCDTPPRLDALTQIDFTARADTDLAWRRLLMALDAAPAHPADEPVPPDLLVTRCMRWRRAVALLRESRRQVYREQAARGFSSLAKEVPPDQLARAMTEATGRSAWVMATALRRTAWWSRFASASSSTSASPCCSRSCCSPPEPACRTVAQPSHAWQARLSNVTNP